MNIFNFSKTTRAFSPRVFNFSSRKVGGIWFVKLGRFTFSFCVSKAYCPIGRKRAAEVDALLGQVMLRAIELELRAYEGGSAMVVVDDRQ